MGITFKNNNIYRLYMDTILQIRGLSKSFGKKQVLDAVDLDINSGEIFGVIGMSGAGKTTLLEILIGFIKPDNGTIMFIPRVTTSAVPENTSPVSITKEPDTIKKIFGFATQEPSFYDKLTVEENLRYFASLYNLKKEDIANKINSILDFVDLSDEKQTLAGDLSGGMKKRLDIACSLINNPSILILDEPTADLDPVSRKHIWNLIKKINAQGSTIIVSSHFLEEMDILCNRIAWLHNKKIIHKGTTDELRTKYTQTQEIHLETVSGNYDKIIAGLAGLDIFKIDKQLPKLMLFTKDSENVLHKLLHLIEDNKETVVSIDIKKPSLDEVFESLIKEKQ